MELDEFIFNATIHLHFWLFLPKEKQVGFLAKHLETIGAINHLSDHRVIIL